MMLVGRLGDSLFAMPAPLGHGSTGIAEPRVVEYPMNIDGCLGDEVLHPTTIPALAAAHQSLVLIRTLCASCLSRINLQQGQGCQEYETTPHTPDHRTLLPAYEHVAEMHRYLGA